MNELIIIKYTYYGLKIDVFFNIIGFLVVFNSFFYDVF